MNIGLFFGVFQILFVIAFLGILGVIIFTVIQGLRQWNRNNHSPRLTVRAVVAGRRTAVHHHHGAGVNEPMHSHISTTYYVTFQVESGDRMELPVSGSEYGMLIEGDRGDLTFQGTRYLNFQRI